jgi:hypothetical protein
MPPFPKQKKEENLDVCTFDSMDLEAVTLRFMLKKLTSRSHGCFLSLHVSIFWKMNLFDNGKNCKIL